MPLLDAILSVVAPHTCLICGDESKLICGWCAPDAFAYLPSRCYRCQRLTEDFAVCERCKRKSKLGHVWICTGYEDAAKTLLRQYKYERIRAALEPIANAMDEILPYLSADTMLVPVPTATIRLRQRGYDHAALLARQLARNRHTRWLRAVTNLSQTRQVGANREQRMSQLKDAFVVTKLDLVKGANILLVDDVVTTGATLEAMAVALKKAGAKSINAVAFTQKR